MDAKSLMIGDWVCYEGDCEYTCPVKVDGIYIDDVSVDGEGFLGGIEGCIIPIPITNEILEANWITDCEMFNGCVVASRIVYCWDGGFMIIKGRVIPAKITFVHELQHALRLCGLNELADNFKIK